MLVEDDNGYGTPFGDKFYEVTYITVDNGEPGKEIVSFLSNMEYDVEQVHQKIQEMFPNSIILKVCAL